MDPFGSLLLLGVLLIGLLTVLISVLVYLSRGIFASSRSKLQKAFWVLGSIGLVFIVAVVVLVVGVVVIAPYSEFD
jgi:hypothetical protein